MVLLERQPSGVLLVLTVDTDGHGIQFVYQRCKATSESDPQDCVTPLNLNFVRNCPTQLDNFIDFLITKALMAVIGRRSWRTTLLICSVLLSVYLLLIDRPPPLPPTNDDLDVAQVVRDIENRDPVSIISYEDVLKRSPLKNFAPKTKNKTEVIGKAGDALLQTVRYHRLWSWADSIIKRNELFPDSPRVQDVLAALRNAKIVHVDQLDMDDYASGTSEKWVITLDGGQRAMMKISWEDFGTMKKHAQCNFGYEMPASEIAAFHLHRLLGFRNTPYVSGRQVDLLKEILPVASPAVAKQITKRDNQTCVVGKCYFCKKPSTLCPPGGIVIASIAYWVPRKLKLYTQPPKYMPFSTPRIEEWGDLPLNNRTFCNKLRTIHPYELDWYYHDLFDFGVLDTLMYHYDSKHYVIYDNTDARGLTVRLDHGRAFCAHDRHEYRVFLAPISQCCTLRKSTWETLTSFRKGEMTRKLRQMLSVDVLNPILTEIWFSTLEERLGHIIHTFNECAKVNGGFENVLVEK